MPTATKRTAKKAPAKRTAKKVAAAPAEQNGTVKRGRSSDLGKYELFAQWALEERGFEVDPEQAQFTMLNYKDFQGSELNKQYNAEKSAARQPVKKAATPAPVSAKKTAAKKTAASESAPAASKRVARKGTAAKKTARTRSASTEEF